MSSGFVTESEIAEARRIRQEEWEKVRTEDQPAEAPEEVYDSRPLYARLDEQKQRKDAEYEETHKLKNMIRGLDDDEIGFLDLVERTKETVAHKIALEEKREMQEFRERVNTLSEAAEKQRLAKQLEVPKKNNNVTSTKNKLQGVIVRKRKLSDPADSPTIPTAKQNGSPTVPEKRVNTGGEKSEPKTEPVISLGAAADMGAMQCIGVLPGLGTYEHDSSDSDCSCDTDEESHGPSPRFDMMGRLCHDEKKHAEVAKR